MSCRRAEVRLDAPAELREAHDLRIGQCRLLLSACLDRLLVDAAFRRGLNGEVAFVATVLATTAPSRTL